MSATKKHLLILFLVIFLPLMAVAFLNISVDPYAVFGVKRVTGYNHFLSDSFYRSSGIELKKYRVKSHIQRAEGPILFIGSSKILWGMDTCNLNGVDRAGLYGLSFDESTEFLISAIESGSYNQIYVEILSNRFQRDSIDQLPTVLNPAMYLGYSTLKISYANLLDSRKYSSLEKMNCFSYSTSQNPIEAADNIDPERQKSGLQEIKNQALKADDLLNLFQSLGSVCNAANQEKINITYFFSPTHPNSPQIENIIAVKGQNRRILSEFLPAETGNCTINYVDIDVSLNNQYDLTNKSYWFDLAHFSPELGDITIKELMGLSEQQ